VLLDLPTVCGKRRGPLERPVGGQNDRTGRFAQTALNTILKSGEFRDLRRRRRVRVGFTRSESGCVPGELRVEWRRVNGQVTDHRVGSKRSQLHRLLQIVDSRDAAEYTLPVRDHPAGAARAVVARVPIQEPRILFASDLFKGIKNGCELADLDSKLRPFATGTDDADGCGHQETSLK